MSFDAASVAFREAMTETRIYLASGQRSGERDYDKEASLARFWLKASSESRRHAKRLSDVCLEMSNYWACPSDNPFEHSQEILDSIEIIFNKDREGREIMMRESKKNEGVV